MAEIHALLRDLQNKRGLRAGSIETYAGALKRIGVTDDSLSRDELESRILELDNLNARRTVAIAVRAVLGIKVRVPKAQPARYDLPSEDSLRLALMLSKNETRCLLMMYAGLRISEACAVNGKSLREDRVRIDRQVLELHPPGQGRVIRLGPPKGSERDAIIPLWLCDQVSQLEGTVTPTPLRENLVRSGKKVGIHLNPHLLRHWYATESLERGMSIAALSKQLGHSSVAITMNTYAQSKESDVHKAWG